MKKITMDGKRCTTNHKEVEREKKSLQESNHLIGPKSVGNTTLYFRCEDLHRISLEAIMQGAKFGEEMEHGSEKGLVGDDCGEW